MDRGQPYHWHLRTNPGTPAPSALGEEAGSSRKRVQCETNRSQTAEAVCPLDRRGNAHRIIDKRIVPQDTVAVNTKTAIYRYLFLETLYFVEDRRSKCPACWKPRTPPPGKMGGGMFTSKNFFCTHLTGRESCRKIKYDIRPSKNILQEAQYETGRSTGVCQSILPFA